MPMKLQICIFIGMLLAFKKGKIYIYIYFFFVQFNVPFKIISLISRRANQKVGRKWEYPGKNHLIHAQVELDLSHL